MTLEIIVFVLAILFGIVWYWRESKSNKLYRLANRITHTKELQMKPENTKGFLHRQPFLLRLVWITLLFVLAATVVSLVTPVNAFYVQYFVSAIAGTLIGTFVASALIFAQDSAKKENLDKVLQRGKDLVGEITEAGEPVEEEKEAPVPEPEATPKKSARDRLKDKGMIK